MTLGTIGKKQKRPLWQFAGTLIKQTFGILNTNAFNSNRYNNTNSLIKLKNRTALPVSLINSHHQPLRWSNCLVILGP